MSENYLALRSEWTVYTMKIKLKINKINFFPRFNITFIKLHHLAPTVVKLFMAWCINHMLENVKLVRSLFPK